MTAVASGHGRAHEDGRRALPGVWVPGPAVHLGCLHPGDSAARLDADHRVAVPAEVDVPGLSGGVPAGSAAVIEQTGGWEYGRIALVLGAWCVGGLILCLLTFRWKDRRG